MKKIFDGVTRNGAHYEEAARVLLELDYHMSEIKTERFYHEGFKEGFELAESKFRKGYARYEKLRKLNPKQFHDLWVNHLSSGQQFDDMVDQL